MKYTNVEFLLLSADEATKGNQPRQNTFSAVRHTIWLFLTSRNSSLAAKVSLTLNNNSFQREITLFRNNPLYSGHLQRLKERVLIIPVLPAWMDDLRFYVLFNSI